MHEHYIFKKKETFQVENICFKKGYQISSKLCMLSNTITRISYFYKIRQQKNRPLPTPRAFCSSPTDMYLCIFTQRC